jgi:hypothetical protein
MTRTTILFLIVVVGTGFINAQAQTMDYFDLGDYKWQNRVLLVFSPNTFNSDYRDQVKDLRSSKSGIKERDLNVFYALNQSSALAKGQIIPDDATENLRNHFDISSSDFTVLLIGKDGTEKLRSDGAVSTTKLFKTIDAMPMRKLEMKNDGDR